MKILAVDPSLRGFGMAKFLLDPDTLELELLELELVKTESDKSKKVRRNSDDLRRAREISKRFQALASDRNMVFAEIPTGSQSARSNLSFGMMIGILANSPRPVMPVETKLASVGKKTASKEEIIAWAVDKYPNGDWRRYKRKGQLLLADDNEHLADACAIAEAGLLTDEFERTLAIISAAA